MLRRHQGLLTLSVHCASSLHLVATLIAAKVLGLCSGEACPASSDDNHASDTVQESDSLTDQEQC